MYGGEKRFLCGNLRESDHLDDPGVDGKIILRLIFRKCDGWGIDWIKLARDRDRRRALVNEVMNLRVSMKCGEFLDQLQTV